MNKKITWIDVAMGAWLIASPVVFSYAVSRPIVVAENIAPGLFLLVTSVWILSIKSTHLRLKWAQTLAGIWLILGSFVLLFDHLPRAAANAGVIGVCVLAASLAATSLAQVQQ